MQFENLVYSQTFSQKCCHFAYHTCSVAHAIICHICAFVFLSLHSTPKLPMYEIYSAAQNDLILKSKRYNLMVIKNFNPLPVVLVEDDPFLPYCPWYAAGMFVYQKSLHAAVDRMDHSYASHLGTGLEYNQWDCVGDVGDPWVRVLEEGVPSLMVMAWVMGIAVEVP